MDDTPLPFGGLDESVGDEVAASSVCWRSLRIDCANWSDKGPKLGIITLLLTVMTVMVMMNPCVPLTRGDCWHPLAGQSDSLSLGVK